MRSLALEVISLDKSSQVNRELTHRLIINSSVGGTLSCERQPKDGSEGEGVVDGARVLGEGEGEIWTKDGEGRYYSLVREIVKSTLDAYI